MFEEFSSLEGITQTPIQILPDGTGEAVASLCRWYKENIVLYFTSFIIYIYLTHMTPCISSGYLYDNISFGYHFVWLTKT